MGDADAPKAVREAHWVRKHGLNTGSVFGLTTWGVSRLPRRVSYAIGRFGTWLAFHVMTEATSALAANLRVVMPHLDEQSLRALVLRTYRSYAEETIDYIRSASVDRGRLKSLLSPASTFRRVPGGGKGVVVLTGHIGNIELGAALVRAVFEYPVTVVAVPEPDPRVNAQRVALRRALGIESLEVREAVDTALRIRRRLADNEAVAIVSDRPVGRDRVEVEFFGRPTPFLKTPALIGYLTGAPLLPSFILRQSDGLYGGFAFEPIYVSREGDRDANVRAAMQAFARVLEQQVRAYPHLWYQFYPYWGEESEPGR
jgi:lauroyl/myristoyl acyltransferase